MLTSAGTAAGIDLCLHLVRRDHGAAIANRVAKRMVVSPHRTGDQAQFVDAPVPPRDARRTTISAVMQWALERLDQRIGVPDLARAAHLSTRTLTRRFAEATGTSPARWLLEQRIAAGAELLERTDTPVEDVGRARRHPEPRRVPPPLRPRHGRAAVGLPADVRATAGRALIDPADARPRAPAADLPPRRQRLSARACRPTRRSSRSAPRARCPPRRSRTSPAAPAPARRCAPTARRSTAGGSCRGCCATSRTRDTTVELFGRTLPYAVPRRADRRVGDGPQATPTSPSPARPSAEGVPDGLLQPGLAGRWRSARGDGRRAALVPALLEQVRRARRELRRSAPRRAAARRSSSRSTRRCSAGARATSTSATCRSCAARASRSTRATRCSTASSTSSEADPDAGDAGRAAQADAGGGRALLAQQRARRSSPRAGPALHRHLLAPVADAGRTSPFLRERTKLPILLKGICHPDDARRAVDEGIDGLVVSNHGGRQVDGAVGDARRAARRRRGGRRAASRSCSTAASAPARTSSRRSRSARARCSSGGRGSTGWRSPARTACARCSRTSQADFDLTMGLAGCASVGEIDARARSCRREGRGPRSSSARRAPSSSSRSSPIRLLAPYVGSTLETYTMIIGAVLAGIAGGAALGGRARRRDRPAAARARRCSSPAALLAIATGAARARRSARRPTAAARRPRRWSSRCSRSCRPRRC